jgi:hypothetical protein
MRHGVWDSTSARMMPKTGEDEMLMKSAPQDRLGGCQTNYKLVTVVLLLVYESDVKKGKHGARQKRSCSCKATKKLVSRLFPLRATEDDSR